ncbi:glucosaminidase domain-containing protein [Clostridium carnis]
MDFKGTYRGIGQYKNYEINKSIKKHILITVFFIVLIVTLFIGGFRAFKGNEEIVLTYKAISKYIDVSDEMSKDNMQLNWQEIAAIDGYINNKDFEKSSKEELKTIANKFFNIDSNNKASIKNFKEVLMDFKFKEDEENNATKILNGISTNYLHKEIAHDKEKLDFINFVSKEAIKNYNQYGILPSITIAQAILESGWGNSQLSDKYNNLFGIKADERWNGDKISMRTGENYNDVIDDYFRTYKNKEASIRDHGKFLSENERYGANGVFEAKTYKGQAEALERAGYSTAKDETGTLIYAEKLIRVIRENNLMLFDYEAQKK